ncbi:MAG: SDR family oxidoreductase, partial [Myxococcales bacterium]|nr:SDR family oxidoreductase [Myxococcales bacterium]
TSIRAMMAAKREAEAKKRAEGGEDAVSSASWMKKKSKREENPQVRFACPTVKAEQVGDRLRPPSQGRLLFVFDSDEHPLRHASYQRSHRSHAAALADFEAMFALNTTAPFHLIQLALPALKARRGAVVNVSSVTGIRSFPGVLAYCSSKAALDQLTRCVALELAADGVRVNAVCPGVVVSQLHRRGGMDEARYAAFLEHSKTTHPLGRVGEPDEIAALILFLGGGESGWITGVTMPIDGGRHLTCAR